MARLCVKIRVFAHTGNPNMTFQTTIQPSGYHFPIEAHETILDAALRHGYSLPYSCREGDCGICKGKIMEGQVELGKHLSSALTAADKAAGITLFCCAKPKSDLVVECHSAGLISNTPVNITPFSFGAQRMAWPSKDVIAPQPESATGKQPAQT